MEASKAFEITSGSLLISNRNELPNSVLNTTRGFVLMPNHIHILVGMKPSCCLSDLVREIKKASNDFVNGNKLSKSNFSWQEGYGAFSYSHSQLDSVITYIKNQKEHHKAKSFREEYIEFLNKFNVEYKDQFLFNWNE